MIPELRRSFNQQWTEAGYQRLLHILRREMGEVPAYRIAETPVFMPCDLMERMLHTGEELTRRIADDPEYLRLSDAAIPAQYRVAEPGGVRPPLFMTVDFGFVRESDGSLGFRLVELQAFPSIFGAQDVLAAAYVEAYGLDDRLRWILSGMDRTAYWEVLRRVLLAGHDPDEVVLLEVRPEEQKTRVDFRTYAQRLGIRTVDIEQVRRVGDRLEYEAEGQWRPIRRIFNRAIADEMERLGVRPGWDLQAAVDVEWAGHPNWYFRASKFSLPFLAHPAVPRAIFLKDWMDEPGRLDLPLDDVLLKPLFSFSGKGIRFAPTLDELRAIPEARRGEYLLQERVHFEPVIETPHGPTQAEIRLMYVWPEGGALQPVISLMRLGRGKMMGVDQNRTERWVGGSATLLPPCA